MKSWPIVIIDGYGHTPTRRSALLPGAGRMAPAFRWKTAFRGRPQCLSEAEYNSIPMKISTVRRGFRIRGGDPRPPFGWKRRPPLPR